MNDPKSRIVDLLKGAAEGSSDPERAEEIYALVYPQLRELAEKIFRDERSGHTLQPTALVHEAYMRCLPGARQDDAVDDRADGERFPEDLGRTHFFAAGARAMRRVLIDHARGRGRDKRGGQWRRVTLTDRMLFPARDGVDAMDLSQALTELSEIDPQQAELVELRFFGGLSLPQAAALLGLAQRTAEREWTLSKAWLRRRLEEGPGA